jgi:hypothetical protein
MNLMKKMLLIFPVLAILAALAGPNIGTMKALSPNANPSKGSRQIVRVHPIIKNIFYHLPLESSRLELREAILKDQRFVLTDTSFNNFPPSTFFKGITTNKGLIESDPDSIQVMLIYGNAALVTEKGGAEDTTKHPMILECRYYFSNQETAEKEYKRLLNWVHPVFTDKSLIVDDAWETEYSMGKQKGTQKCIGKMMDSYDPYFRLAISTIAYIPSDGSKPVFVLDIAFSKEDE